MTKKIDIVQKKYYATAKRNKVSFKYLLLKLVVIIKTVLVNGLDSKVLGMKDTM